MFWFIMMFVLLFVSRWSMMILHAEEDLSLSPDGPVVKICGLTRLEDVCAARDLGVWALGFVFAPSPRRLTPAAARGLLEAAGLGRAPRGRPGRGGGAEPTSGAVSPAGRPRATGTRRRPYRWACSSTATRSRSCTVVDEVGLDAVQLHGIGGPSTGAVAAALGGRERPVLLIIRALPVDPDAARPGRLRQAIAEATAGRRHRACSTPAGAARSSA